MWCRAVAGCPLRTVFYGFFSGRVVGTETLNLDPGPSTKIRTPSSKSTHALCCLGFFVIVISLSLSLSGTSHQNGHMHEYSSGKSTTKCSAASSEYCCN